LEKSSIADSIFDTSAQQCDRGACPRFVRLAYLARLHRPDGSYPNWTLAACCIESKQIV